MSAAFPAHYVPTGPDYTSREIYDMVMLRSAYDLLDRMPEAPHTPILITEPLSPAPRPAKAAIRVTKPKADPAAKAHKAAATAAAKEALRAAKAAEKAATKETERLRRALAAAERKIAKQTSKPAKKV
jgi:hypothetical protein